MATLDLFATAKTVKAEPKPKASDRVKVAVEGLSELAACRALIGTLEGYAARFEETVKVAAFTKWVQDAFRTRTTPKGYDLVDDHATGKYAFKKKSSLSVIPDDTLPLFDAMKIPYEMKIVQPDHWFFSPDLMEDEKARQVISAALGKEPYLKGKEILCHQEAVLKPVTTDETISEAIKLVQTEAQLLAFGPAIGVNAVSTMFDSPEVAAALAVLEAAGVKLIPDATPGAKGKKK